MNIYTRNQFLYSTYGKPVLIAGKVAIAADASVGANTFGSLVSSVTKTGTGEYTITLASTYNAAQAVDFQVLAAAAVDLVPQIKSIDVTSAKTIVVRLLAVASPANPSAALDLYMVAILNASSI